LFKLSTSTNRRQIGTNPLIPGSSKKDHDLKLKKDIQHQNMLDRISQSEEKVSAKRNYRQQAQINREREIEESFIRAHNDKLIKQQTLEQEEKLASELERYKIEQLRDSKMRQQLRETR
jgi:hypothetical protein